MRKTRFRIVKRYSYIRDSPKQYFRVQYLLWFFWVNESHDGVEQDFDSLGRAREYVERQRNKVPRGRPMVIAEFDF